MKFLDKIFGDTNKKVLDKIQPKIEAINSFEKEIGKLSPAQIKERTQKIKEKIQKELEKRSKEWEDISDEKEAKERRRKIELEVLDEVLPEVFALVREAARRTIGERHFDVQLLGGIVLHEGKISEMKTGEGKTLVATLSVTLNALTGRGVHIVTVNDYLARRDTGWMGEIYNFLGLTVGTIIHDESFQFDKSYEAENVLDPKLRHLKPVSRREAYECDITYGTNNEFGFDYLRDNMVADLSEAAQRELHYAIVDEVDSILIDEARTPLIISAPAEESTEKYYQFARLIRNLKEHDDYAIDEKLRAATLTEEGIAKMEKLLGVSNIYEQGGVELVHHLEQALRAETLFKKDRDYVVKDGEVIIVDEFTGRLMFGRRYSEGLHQAIEAKEGVEIKRESRTLATITFQNYFRMYEKLAGMTGTAATEAEEFHRIYKLEVVEIPTNEPMIREDLQDLIYKTEEAKFKAVVEDIKERYQKGQPVLVGTVSIKKNERLADLLKRDGIPFELLNAKNHEREAQIIAQAGKPGAVTVATNMAGRGVDIILGGRPPAEIKNQKSKIKNEEDRELKQWKEEHEKVKKIGGLTVIGTERHESRRIDNQLRGRSGRQGDLGVSRFHVSLEDDLMRIFGSDRVKGMMDALGLPEDQPIEHGMLSRAIESAQKKVEGNNFDIRKHLLEYDDVINKHREGIYSRRKKVLESESLKEEILEILSREVASLISFYLKAEAPEEEKKKKEPLREIEENLRTILPHGAKIPELSPNAEKLIESVFEAVISEYEKKEKETGEKEMRFLEKAVYLRIIDTWWIEHLEAIDALKEGIGLRGYGQRDPLVEFKKEAYGLYQRLISGIESDIAHTIFKVGLVREQAPVQQTEAKHEESNNYIPPESAEGSGPQTPITLGKEAEFGGSETSVTSSKKVGRNDPCPCGATDPKTGKPIKYKKCHGK